MRFRGVKNIDNSVSPEELFQEKYDLIELKKINTIK
jgi:hypothetical protein